MLTDTSRKNFEKQLKLKLQLKETKRDNPESVLLKAFRYYDLDNSNDVDRSEWIKALNNISVTGFSEDMISELFDIYDANQDGRIDYKEFISGLFGYTRVQVTESKTVRPEILETKGSKTNKEFLQSNSINDILAKIREKLANRGTKGIFSIGRAFRIMDDDRSGGISLSEFKKASNDFRFDLDEDEVEKAFIAFDRNNNGALDYDEFLRQVRGNMNNFRKRFVDQVFKIMDVDNNGFIDINDVKQSYNARFHPDVKSGKRTEEEVLNEFIETFEIHHNLLAKESADHIVTREEWQEYYENVSISIDDDKYFELMMNNAWRINDATTKKNELKGWTNKNEDKTNLQNAYKSNKISSPFKSKGENKTNVQSAYRSNRVSSPPKSLTGSEKILDKFRKACHSRGGKGIIGLARQFKIFDDDGTKTLEFTEFTKALRDYKLDISQNELKLLFNHFDVDGNGYINYDEFLREIRGDMNDRRKAIVLKAFNKLDSDNNGIIDVNDLKYIYNAKFHPDVVSRKKSEEEVLEEFLETYENHLNIKNKTTKDHIISKEEFLEYYNNISSSIDDDIYFEEMISNVWKLKQITPKPWDVKENRESPLKAGKKIWMNDHYKAQAKGGTVSEYAPFGTSKDPIDYSTANRTSVSGKNNPHTLLCKLREKIILRGARGIIGLGRAFRIADDDNSKSIEYNEFRKLLKDYRLIVEEDDCRKLFNSFDLDGSGTIDYEEFVRTVVGEMNDFRKNIVKKAFNKFDKNGNGVIEVDDLIDIYNARMHPDVRSGKKTEEEVFGDFIDNFENHFAIRNKGESKDRRIEFEEFVEYYNHISMSIDDDTYFEVMMTNCWNLDEKKGFSKGWKGEY